VDVLGRRYYTDFLPQHGQCVDNGPVHVHIVAVLHEDDAVVAADTGMPEVKEHVDHVQ